MDGKKEVSSVHSLATSPPILSFTRTPFKSGPGENDFTFGKKVNQTKLQYTLGTARLGGMRNILRVTVEGTNQQHTAEEDD